MKQLDFLNNPDAFMNQIKNDSRDFVQDQYNLTSYISKTKNVFKQFYARINPFNELYKDQPSFILKTRRIQYTFERYRQLQEQEAPVTIKDMADRQLVNEIRFWATKYITMAWIGGLNIGYLSYHFGLKKLKRFVGIPLTFIVFFESRNLIMKSCMDKIYFSLEPLYIEMRANDKKKEQKALKGGESNSQKYMDPLDMLKERLMAEQRQENTVDLLAKEELNIEQQQAKIKFDQLINQMHGKFINEQDFITGKAGYKKFIDLYISLYYEPLVEDFEETRYFTKDFDKQFLNKIKYSRKKKLTELSLK
ncbi:UNKNOWN [Stylonychia lemnae]|uniref:Uncharacterized protein n=1 Tax=Stylonychia lemnae TaxID=5949 RepID=A0A078A7G8_STYLE|nr:UNKNOWN [Stylonychia lemnae]|eukprot:CDW77492.1 UNKNOWN [Stylonychia lemnae]